MKPVLLENVISEKELYFIYNEIIGSNGWNVSGITHPVDYPSNKNFLKGPVLLVKNENEPILNYAFYLYGQSLIYKIMNFLSDRKIGMYSKLERMWFNITYNGKETQHWLHQDNNKDTQSIVMFMTPFWKQDWKGSFFVDGEKFSFKPGSAVIFDSKEFHTGESPESETFNWQKLMMPEARRQNFMKVPGSGSLTLVA
jgi:hypothetical protein